MGSVTFGEGCRALKMPGVGRLQNTINACLLSTLYDKYQRCTAPAILWPSSLKGNRPTNY